ncbi:MAG: hypothetical protein SAK29_17190 [Scytonema sp. PMC 1069.18]|nr:hypothetical protein [Scytonema sp. PMC 1069.18]MEC4883728.1 hypothetical protein [Scytonema sp. PMC 1070.18]
MKSAPRLPSVILQLQVGGADRDLVPTKQYIWLCVLGRNTPRYTQLHYSVSAGVLLECIFVLGECVRNRRHYEETGHTVISSAELGEQWLWCFEHSQQKNY